MKKSVYSLVLMDDVIEAVDRMAYQMNTSRSNLINQILAHKLMVMTPEMQMKNVFNAVEELLGSYQHFQIQQQAADSMISIKSVLRYKYNPTIRYAISLNRDQRECVGELKLISRSQSDVLQGSINAFLEIWSQCEKQNHLPGWQGEQSGRWSRSLQCVEASADEEQIARCLAGYIKAIDQGLKIYFEYMAEPGQGKINIHNHFYQYIQKATMLL
ncbi:MAG: hypothetical protein ACRCWY_05240 [Cellulosilyticaceae bacterium]